ncbi:MULTISPECIES: DNA-binding protein [unclassified Pseudoalteromonas]|uniref:DNA-binding protein n=1 Tax=unclassified Pseudoalteromonas TaxID=194690 RepID=UPI001EF70CA9|nr:MULTISPECIES: DNA-binding protein [unclassified Pseudoalteromonas]MCG7553287.1 DNA-binding protein [Pseudoalteromonas sp. Of11M-6]MCG9758771.1 DNA-binding protein [Pseudoalteromonas sp. Isolate6]
MSNQLILSLASPILTYDEYARLQGQKVKDVVNAVANGRLPTYTPPCAPHENPARVKKYINMVALYAEAAKAANLEFQVQG